jgi:hypothetical protein
MFPALHLPSHPLRTEMRDGTPAVLCMVRKKWVVLTPEEWVRQHLTAYLHHDLGYPLSLMKMERQVKGGERRQRADISIHDRDGHALMLVECKAADEPLNRETIFQAGRYNQHIHAPYLLVSNGMKHFCCAVDGTQLNFLDAIPFHSSLKPI